MAQVQRTKMLWYYSRIIDWMIANPGAPLSDCAKMIGRTQSTLSIIINSDMFKVALAQRKSEFQQAHDFGIIQKTTKIAHASLDAILLQLDKKKDAVPMETLIDLSESALGRLGYASKPQPGATPVSVTVNQQNNVILPVSHQDLEEARMALRQVQASQAKQLPPQATPSEYNEVIDVEATEAEPLELKKEAELAPSTSDS